MTNVGESYQSRLSRERAALLANFIPAKRSLQEKLRQQQDLKTQFATGTEELFKPITTATEKVVTAIETSKPPPPPPPSKKTYSEKLQTLRNRFKAEFLTKVDENKIDDLYDFAAVGYYEKEKYLQPDQPETSV